MDGQSASPHIYTQADMRQRALHSLAGGRAAVFTTRSPAKETVNEDAAALIPVSDDSAVLIVADGLGGHASGEEASLLAIFKIQDSVVQTVENGAGLRTAILNGIEEANRAVLGLAGDAATTLAVVEIKGRSIRPYHVGDSVILLVGNRGKMKLQTVAHSPVAYAVEAGILDEQHAMHHDDRHLISNVIGAPEMRIEIGPVIEMATRDTLLLASDGLADNLHVSEMVECIRKGPLPKVAQLMAEETLARMENPQEGHPSKPDDLTFIVFRCGGK